MAVAASKRGDRWHKKRRLLKNLRRLFDEGGDRCRKKRRSHCCNGWRSLATNKGDRSRGEEMRLLATMGRLPSIREKGGTTRACRKRRSLAFVNSTKEERLPAWTSWFTATAPPLAFLFVRLFCTPVAIRFARFLSVLQPWRGAPAGHAREGFQGRSETCTARWRTYRVHYQARPKVDAQEFQEAGALPRGERLSRHFGLSVYRMTFSSYV